MALAGKLNAPRILAEQGRDVIEMFQKGRPVALPLINLVPLIVIVKNQRDNVVKIHEEAIVG